MEFPKNITEAMDNLERIAHYYLERLYPNGKVPSIKRGGDLGENEKTDSDLHLEIEEWVFITPFWSTEEYPCIGGKKTREAIHYSIQRAELVRGTYRYADGSGEPDTVDIVEVKLDKPLTSVFQAIEYACKMLYQNELDAIGEGFQEEEWARAEMEERELAQGV